MELNYFIKNIERDVRILLSIIQTLADYYYIFGYYISGCDLPTENVITENVISPMIKKKLQSIEGRVEKGRAEMAIIKISSTPGRWVDKTRSLVTFLPSTIYIIYSGTLGAAVFKSPPPPPESVDDWKR